MKPRQLSWSQCRWESLKTGYSKTITHTPIHDTHTSTHVCIPPPLKGHAYPQRQRTCLLSQISQELKEKTQGTCSKSQEQGRATLRGEVLLLPSSCSFHQTALPMWLVARGRDINTEGPNSWNSRNKSKRKPGFQSQTWKQTYTRPWLSVTLNVLSRSKGGIKGKSPQARNVMS